MQMYPRDGGYKEQYYEEEYVVHEDDHGKGSNMHMMMKPHDQFKNKNGQHAHHGYGGHNDGQHGYGGHHEGHHKNGVESYSAQYAETWYEKEGRDDAWKLGNDYSAHGGNGYGHNGGMKHNGYGAHEGHNGGMMKHNGYGAHEGHNGGMLKHNGYGAHEGHNGGMMKHNGYGAHEGHTGPHKERHVPIWKFKGISD